MTDSGSSLWPFSLLDDWWLTLTFGQQLAISWGICAVLVAGTFTYCWAKEWRQPK